MGSQRQLNALLFELQTARSPLHQAKTLARAWRTVRDLSPTDRRLLARHVGFDGAEQMLEGLAEKRGGLAPALLLQALANVRSTDGAEVAEVVAGLREPDTRGQAVADGLDLATGLLVEPEFDDGDDDPDDPSVPYEVDHDDVDEVGGALGELQAVHPEDDEAPEAALAALTALERDPKHVPQTAVEEDEERAPEPPPEDAASEEEEASQTIDPPPAKAADAELRPAPAISPPELVRRPEIVDWSRWEPVERTHRPAPSPRYEPPAEQLEPALPVFDAHAVLVALGAQRSIISQLQVLRHELSGFAGSSVDTLRQVADAFPDGWARRRALAALLEAGLPPGPDDAIELISGLQRDSDRAWCLGILARQGVLRGGHLERALALLESPAARRRVETAAARFRERG